MEQFRNVCQLFTEKWKYVKRTEMCSASATMWSKLIVISMEYVFCVYFVYWEQPNGKNFGRHRSSSRLNCTPQWNVNVFENNWIYVLLYITWETNVCNIFSVTIVSIIYNFYMYPFCLLVVAFLKHFVKSIRLNGIFYFIFSFIFVLYYCNLFLFCYRICIFDCY